MEEQSYKTRLKVTKRSVNKANDAKKMFIAANLTNVDIVDTTYEARLEYIREKLGEAQEIIGDLVLDLDESNATDIERISALATLQETLEQEIIKNEAEVKAKVEELRSAPPITKAEQETLDLKKKKFDQEEELKKVAKVEKKERVQVDIEDVSTRASSIIEILSKIDDVSKLTDLKVSEALTESKKWENKITVITASKVKIDKDCIGLDLDQKSKENLADLVKEAKTGVDTKITKLKDFDSTRVLFSLGKSVKEMAPYPKAFEGKNGEDVSTHDEGRDHDDKFEQNKSRCPVATIKRNKCCPVAIHDEGTEHEDKFDDEASAVPGVVSHAQANFGSVNAFEHEKKAKGYDDHDDWMHRTVERPASTIVKLFHIDDTTLKDDLQAVHKLYKEMLDTEKIYVDVKLETNEQASARDSSDGEIVEVEKNNDQDSDDFEENPMPIKKPLKRKKKTELEKLKIDMEGWSMMRKVDVMKDPTTDTMQAVMRTASPFIHNFMKATHVSTTAQGEPVKRNKEVPMDKDMEMGDRGGAEFEDKIFNVMYEDNSFDEMNIYML